MLMPMRIDPYRMAEQNCSFTGSFALADMLRISAVSSTDMIDCCQAPLHFAWRQGNSVRRVTVAVQAHLPFICQCCLGEMKFKVDSSSELVLVRHEIEARRFDDSKIFLLEDASLVPSELVEDELLLSVPIVLQYQMVSSCTQRVHTEFDVVDVQTELDGVNLFHVLEVLKNDTMSS